MGGGGRLIPKFLPRVISKPCAKINSANFWLQWWGGAGRTEVLVKKFKICQSQIYCSCCMKTANMCISISIFENSLRGKETNLCTNLLHLHSMNKCSDLKLVHFCLFNCTSTCFFTSDMCSQAPPPTSILKLSGRMRCGGQQEDVYSLGLATRLINSTLVAYWQA
jgi:hypothetical protein